MFIILSDAKILLQIWMAQIILVAAWDGSQFFSEIKVKIERESVALRFLCFEDHIQALLVTFSPFRPNKYLKLPCNIIVNGNPGNCYSVAFTFRVLSDLQDLKVLYVKI